MSEADFPIGSNRMLLRSKEGVEVFDVPTKSGGKVVVEKVVPRQFLLKGATTLQQYAPDGSCVYLHQPSNGVVMCPLNERSTITSTSSTGTSATIPFLKDTKSVQMLATSPKGTYLVTWERLSSTNPEQPNLKIWNSKTGTYLHGFVQKNLRREGWPYIHWSHDEKYAFLMVTNEIRVFEGHVFLSEGEKRFIDKMRCPGISTMSVPKTADTTTPYLVSSFVPGTKDKPARASLHKYDPSTPVPPNSTTYPTICTKTLFQAEEVAVHWSPKGDAALMALQTSVDTSGESYYGSTTLHLMSETGAVTVPLPSPGPVLDVAWMPNPNKPSCFAVIAGRMPAMASLHHGSTGEATFLFGNAHRNTLSWTEPHGRFLNIAGFGNLAGGMTFWDRNKLKAMPQYDEDTGIPIYPEIVASCTVGYGWSPDGRCFGVSTTSPRMNVDNGVRVFTYNGKQLLTDCLPWDNKTYQPDRLLQASFVPALPDVHPDRPQSPAPRIVGGDAAAIAEAKRRATEAAKKPATTSTKRYVPPSARGGKGPGSNSLAERMRREKEGSMMTATKVTNKPRGAASVTTAGKAMPVGMVAAAPGEGKSKTALRREKQKQNKAKQEAEEKSAVAEAVAEATQVDPEKRAKKLKKQLRQIEELKEREQSTLNEDQQKKVDSEVELRAELASLGL